MSKAKVESKAKKAGSAKKLSKEIANIKRSKASKSEKARRMIDAGIDSPKAISDALGMHYSHVVTVKREYKKQQKSSKKTSA